MTDVLNNKLATYIRIKGNQCLTKIPFFYLQNNRFPLKEDYL